jgi:hypothetical protein
MSNDATNREQRWRRHDGDCWACFDTLPPAVRWRMQQNAYDVWSVNALMLWRSFRRQLASSHKAEQRLLRYLEQCESLERADYAAAYCNRHGMPLPHLAAGASVLRVSRHGAWPDHMT